MSIYDERVLQYLLEECSQRNSFIRPLQGRVVLLRVKMNNLNAVVWSNDDQKYHAAWFMDQLQTDETDGTYNVKRILVAGLLGNKERWFVYLCIFNRNESDAQLMLG